MDKLLLRTFKEFDFDDVRAHMLIMGDLKGDCAACKEIGLDQYSVKTCPNCGVTFTYVTSRRLDGNPGDRFQLVKRMREKRPELVIIDYHVLYTTYHIILLISGNRIQFCIF